MPKVDGLSHEKRMAVNSDKMNAHIFLFYEKER